MKLTVFEILETVIIAGMCVLLVVIAGMIVVIAWKEMEKRRGRK